MHELKSLWRGEIALGPAFFGWLILGGLLVNGTTTVMNLILVTRDLSIVGLVIGYAISVPYNLLAMIGVWRAADVHEGDPEAARLGRWLGVVIATVLCVT